MSIGGMILIILGGLLVLGVVVLLIFGNYKKRYKLLISISSCPIVLEKIEDEAVRDICIDKAYANLYKSRIFVKNIGSRKIPMNKSEVSQLIDIEMKAFLGLADYKISQISHKKINPRFEEKQISNEEKTSLNISFDQLGKGHFFLVTLIHNEKTNFKIDAVVPNGNVKIKAEKIFNDHEIMKKVNKIASEEDKIGIESSQNIGERKRQEGREVLAKMIASEKPNKTRRKAFKAMKKDTEYMKK